MRKGPLRDTLQEIRGALAARSALEKRVLLQVLVTELRDELGDEPVSICDPDAEEKVVAYLVPVQAWLRMREAPERLAKLDRRVKAPGKSAKLRDVMRRLETLE